MLRKRPCRICRRWFAPHPRAGDRQRVCGDAECQRERHRRACTSWREQQGDDEKEDRLRRRLRREVASTSTSTSASTSTSTSTADGHAPLCGLDFDVARDAVGREVAVFVEETAKVVVGGARDAVTAQARGITGRSGGHAGIGARDEIGGRARAP